MDHAVTKAPPLVTFGIGGIAVALALLFVIGQRAAAGALGLDARAVTRRTVLAAAGIAAWLALFGAVAAAGLLARFDARPPPFVLALVAIIGGAVAFSRSRAGTAVATGLPIAALVGAQAFRLPLELVMHDAARAGVMPLQMTFGAGGWNYDLVSGATAILVAALAAAGRAPRWLLVAWNALGSALLLAIIAVAVASTPMVRAFGGGPALNTWVAYFPFVWLPSVMVAFALAGHLVLWRRLLARGGAPSQVEQRAPIPVNR